MDFPRFRYWSDSHRISEYPKWTPRNSHLCLWNIQKCKVLPILDHFNYRLSLQLTIRNDESHCLCKFHSCFHVYLTKTAAGNVNEQQITSSAPDDSFQGTPTRVAENSRGKRFHGYIESHIYYIDQHDTLYMTRHFKAASFGISGTEEQNQHDSCILVAGCWFLFNFGKF